MCRQPIAPELDRYMPNHAMKLDKWEEEIFFSTVRLTVEDDQGEDSSIGTGFIIGVPITNDEGDDRGTIVLVSSRHVFEEAERPISLNFHQMNARQTGPELGMVVRLTEAFSEHFLPHPNSDIDLACVGAVGLRLRQDIFFRFTGPGVLADFTEDDLYPGKEVLFVGYPDGRFDWTHNLPIMRFGHIATVPTVDFLDEPAFLIDAPVFEGSSGSAVYTVIDDKYRLIGVITRALYKDDQTLFGAVEIDYQHYLDLGVVLKSTVVRELIEHMVAERFPGCRLDAPE